MNTKRIFALMLSVVMLGGVSPALTAQANPTPPSQSQAVPQTPTQSPEFTTEDYAVMAEELLAGDVPRRVSTQDGLDLVQYDFGEGVTLQIPYIDGQPYIPPTPRVSFGAVWWSAYVELTSGEQAALVGGATGTVLGILAKNPATAGFAATIIAVATTKGICSSGRVLRIYFPSFLMTECVW